MASKAPPYNTPSLVGTPSGPGQGLRSLQTSQRSSIAKPTQVLLPEEVLEETETYCVKAKNWSVPVIVQEELLTHGNVYSSKVHYTGWVLFVTQKRLYMWRQSGEHGPSGICHQLSLTPTGSQWSHSLIDIHSLSPHTPSNTQVLAVSAEGVASFWKSISHEAPYSSLKLELNGDPVYSVKKLQGSDGYALLTCSGTLLLLTPSSSKPLITAVSLGHQRNTFSGFGKRLSSLFFGGGTGTGQINNSVQMVTWYMVDQSFDLLFVLSKTHLQCWKVYSSIEMDQMMLLDFDIASMIKADFQDHQWVKGQMSKLWLLDMQGTCEGLVVLFAVLMESSQVLYGLALLPLFMESPPLSCNVIQLPFSFEYQVNNEAVLLDMSLEGSPSSAQLSLYTKNFLLPIHCSHLNEAKNVQEVSFPEPNRILGSGMFEGELLFFTKQHGVVSLSVFPPTPSASPPKRLKNTYVTSGATLSHLPSAPGGITAGSMERETKQFQEAFFLYLRNNMAKAVELCSQLFPISSFSVGIDTAADIATTRLSEMILNDVPTTDPRWNKTNTSDSLGSYSLIILNQLQDKQKAHKKLIQFLIDMELLDLLTCVSIRGSVLLTRHVLCEHAEKIAASTVLRKMQDKDVEEAVKVVVQKRSPLPQIRSGLTTQDVFYSQVSLIDEVFPSLLNHCEDIATAGDLTIVTKTAFIIKCMLSDAIEYRRTHVGMYTSHRPVHRLYQTEFIPWTACEEMLDLLRRLLCVMLDHWAGCDDQPISDIDQESFWSVYSDLASILFTGLTDLYDSIKDHGDSEHRVMDVQNSLAKDKDHFILSVLNFGKVGVALQLAEDWFHFPTVLQVFEDQGDTEMLRKYLEVFKDKGFDESLFRYYLDSRKFKQLIELTNLFPDSLNKFLDDFPELQWLHLIATDNYHKASESLRRVSEQEDKFLLRKKTALSLSKLALLAGGESTTTGGELEAINCELQKIAYEEKLPPASLKKLGIEDINDLPPLPPDEVIKLFLEENDDELMHTIFALHYLLLAYPDSENVERRELQTLIWSHVSLKTNWSELSMDEDVMEQLEETLMFKLLNECHHNSLDVKQLLPTIEELLSSQLLVDAGLDGSDIYIYCVKLCYERLNEL